MVGIRAHDERGGLLEAALVGKGERDEDYVAEL
jgi:hypothetical protein